MPFSRALSCFARKALASTTRDIAKLQSSNMYVSRSFSALCQRAAFDQVPNRPAFLPRYANLHTEGDRRFVELLKEEISEEKKRLSEIPGMSDGWKISMSGASGTLSKTHDGDNIEVSFTLNGSIPPLEDEEEVEPEEGPLVTYPEFSVKVTKPGSSRALEFECYYPDDVQSGVADETMNLFSIRNAVVYDGEITDETYIIETENLDPDVYSYFMSYLADRNVDQQFAQELIGLTTSAEQHEYVHSLNKLKDFIASK